MPTKNQLVYDGMDQRVQLEAGGVTVTLTVNVGLSRIVALYYCSSILSGIANIFGTSISETTI